MFNRIVSLLLAFGMAITMAGPVLAADETANVPTEAQTQQLSGKENSVPQAAPTGTEIKQDSAVPQQSTGKVNQPTLLTNEGTQYELVPFGTITNIKADSEFSERNVYGDGPAKDAFDGDMNTKWHTIYEVPGPHWIQWSVGEARNLGKVVYRTSGNENGRWNDAVLSGKNGTGDWVELAKVSNPDKNTTLEFVFEPRMLTDLKVDVKTSFAGNPSELNKFANAVEIETYQVKGGAPAPDPDPAPETGAAWQKLHNNGGGTGATGHTYSQAGGAVTALYQGQAAAVGSTLSMKLKVEKDLANFGVFYYYINDNEWLYIGYDPTSHWYYQWKHNGKEKYPGLSGIPNPVKGQELNLSVSLKDNTLAVTVGDVVKTVTNASLQELSTYLAGQPQAKFGLTSKALNDLAQTELLFADTRVDDKAMNGEWALLVPENGTLTAVTESQESEALIALRAQCDAAEKKDLTGYTKASADAFTKALNNAKNVRDSQNLTDEQIKQVADALSQAEKNLAPEEVSSDTKIRYVLSGGAGGHRYSGSGAGPATAIYTAASGKEENTISLDLELDGDINFGIFYYYLNDNEWLYIGYDTSSRWYYQWKHNGKEAYPGVVGLPEITTDEAMNISISLNREVLQINVNGISKSLNDQNLAKISEYMKDKENVRFGPMVKSNTKMTFSNPILNGVPMSDNWQLLTEGKGKLEKTSVPIYSVSGTVIYEDGTPVEEATVRIQNKFAKTGPDGKFTFTGLENGEYSVSASKRGYQAANQKITVADKNLTTEPLVLKTGEELDLTQFDKLENDSMKVYVGKDFPFVAKYEVKNGSQPDLSMLGQPKQINTVKINEKDLVPTNVTTSISGASKTYTMTLNNGTDINLVMTVVISLDGTSLTWQVTKLEKLAGCGAVDIIQVPELNLISVSEADTMGATDEQMADIGFAGATKSLNTDISGDQYINFEENGGFIANEKSEGYLYAFVSNGKLSAGLFSNSEAEGDKRVHRNNGIDYIALTSAPWYYEHGDVAAQKYAASHADENLTFPKSELPVAKVSLAADLNKDGKINWNDGAIAFRDIYNIPMGSEVVKDTVNHRIVMNFASMAPNPYLETADNIKKVYLATDGLPQAIILKGYGNEGHDSANSEYGDIAVREGGVEDFRNLIKIAHKYNTEIGIHVNAHEVYPEARSMSNRMVNYPKVGTGWNWLDQSYIIDKIWDLTSDARWKRLVQLYDRINGTSFLSPEGTWPNSAVNSTRVPTLAEIRADAATRPDNMDMIYLDVWYQNAWETRRIAEQFNAMGWRFSTEFSDQGEYDSTWQHWATDAVYGGKSAKGFNSDIIRFIRNDQRDSQVLNYPDFDGAADNPLLGGYRLGGFEGWVGDQDFNAYLERTYTENLPTRFLQQYQVTKWENYAEGESPVGNHEKEITLQNEKGDIVVVTRNEEQREDDIIERTITLNGVKVLEDDAYLLPWKDYQGDQDKLYHWNVDGGTTTWQLPAGFADASTLVMYQLTDQGRTKPATVTVENGMVTLNVPAKTAYVLVKEAATKELQDDFGEADHAVDPGFNGYTENSRLDAADWTGTIDNKAVRVKHEVTGDQVLVFGETDTDVKVSTTLRNLTPGKHYVAEIYVDNKSDSKATVSVDTGSKTESNYTYRSIAGNFVRCDEHHLSDRYESKMQWIQVPFVAESSTAVFTLAREAGDGQVFWDDIRVAEIELNNFREDGTFVQDFENVVQGIYPFVLGPAQGVDDPATHLSQKNAPYTQSGWHTKTLDDVIEGEWSLKHHTSNKGIIYQTIPQNFRFEPYQAYEISFDYQSSPNRAYAMVVGNEGTYYKPSAEQLLPSTKAPQAGQKSTTKHETMYVVGEPNGQTWIGLFSRKSNEAGENDFILDNLVIRPISDEEALEKMGIVLVTEKRKLYMGETTQLGGVGLNECTITSSDPKVATVDAETRVVSAKGAGTAVITAELKSNSGKSVSASVTITVEDAILTSESTEGMKVITTINGQFENLIQNLLDGDPDTSWDGNWNGVTADDPAVIILDLGENRKMNGITLQNRSTSNPNGMITHYRYSEGKTYDEASKTITDGQMSAWNAVPEQMQAAGIKLSLDLNKPDSRYVRIELQGTNSNVTVAEIGAYKKVCIVNEAKVNDLDLKTGETAALEVVLEPDTAVKGIVWNTSNPDVISISKDGTVTALKAGTAKAILTNAAGLKAEATVTVHSSSLSAPTQVKTSELTHNSVKLTWKAPAETDLLEGYVIKDGSKVLMNVAKDKTEAVLTDLTPKTEYKNLVIYAKGADDVLSGGAAVAAFTTAKEPNPEKPDPEKPDPEKPDPEKPDPEKPNPEKPAPEVKPDPKPEVKPVTPPLAQTGDTSNVGMWLAILIVAVIGVVAVILVRKNKKK